MDIYRRRWLTGAVLAAAGSLPDLHGLTDDEPVSIWQPSYSGLRS